MSDTSSTETSRSSFRPGSAGARAWGRLDGASFIREVLGGQRWDAPHVAILAYDVVDAGEGRVELAWDVPEALLNPAGIAHGGFLTAVLDDAAGLAVASTYPRFVPQLTVQLSTDFLAPVPRGPRYRVVGEVIRRGRSTSHADAHVLDPDGRILTRVTGVFQPNRRAVPREAWADAGLA